MSRQGRAYLPGSVERIPFRGTLLLISESDLRRAPQWTHSAMSQKVCTNGYALTVGSQIEDAHTGEAYTVKGDIGYGDLSPSAVM